MDKDKKLQDLFNNDPLGLLNIKPPAAPARNADERLLASFAEINAFFEEYQREPGHGGGIQEYPLYSRLQSLRANPLKMEMLQALDINGLLHSEQKQITSLEDILNDDALGLLGADDEGLFDLKNIHPIEKQRAETDFVAKRKPCKHFDKYEGLFKAVQHDLKNSKRKLVAFKQDNLREGAYYINNGILFLVEKINITTKEHYKTDGTRVREDGRTRCIFENGTESNMLKRSVEKILYANGKAVSENVDTVNDVFVETFSNIMHEDEEMGYIYILKSKSDKQEIKEIQHLYKIGYSSISVEERIKNAVLDPTYLMAEVHVLMTYQCYNMNLQKFEQLLHNFFGNSCLNIDVFDKVGNRHTPREWFIAPLYIIEQTVALIMSGHIVHYRYDVANELIVKKY